MPNFDEFLPFKTLDETINEITDIINAGNNPLYVHLEIGTAFLFDDQYNYQKITYRSTLQRTNDFVEPGTDSYFIPVFQGKRYWLKTSKISEKLLNPGFQNLTNIQRELLTIKGIVTVNPYDALSVIQWQYADMMSNITTINSFNNNKSQIDTSGIDDDGYKNENDFDGFDSNIGLVGVEGYVIDWGNLHGE